MIYLEEVVVVVAVWLTPELDDWEEDPPRELLTVVLMKGVNWEMILATRSLEKLEKF